jgi:hypothetical protein
MTDQPLQPSAFILQPSIALDGLEPAADWEPQHCAVGECLVLRKDDIWLLWGLRGLAFVGCPPDEVAAAAPPCRDWQRSAADLGAALTQLYAADWRAVGRLELAFTGQQAEPDFWDRVVTGPTGGS